MAEDKNSLHHFRKEYNKHQLSLESSALDPFDQFSLWFHDAHELASFEANAMILSSVNENLQVSSRVVLLKEYSKAGFVFYTNYSSRKGRELEFNPKVSILFFYEAMERQIRIQGEVEKISLEESSNYFASRPLESQYGAMVSPQSEIIPSKDSLEKALERMKNENKKPQMPEHWGGYLLKANYFEFWQGRPNRLHDRVCYEWMESQWNKYIIAP